jgi:hypothetical protein
MRPKRPRLPVHQLPHADDAGRTLAPPDFRPPAAGLLFWQAEFSQQLPAMLLRRCQCLRPPTVFEIGEERGMDSAPALHPHKETVIVLFRLVNPADAGCA